jgi:SET domain
MAGDLITARDEYAVLGRPNHYGNHSCDPNLWWGDAYTLVARRPIAAGEEVTNDHATSTGIASFAMDCACGPSLCRGVITGEDWRRPELQCKPATAITGYQRRSLASGSPAWRELVDQEAPAE